MTKKIFTAKQEAAILRHALRLRIQPKMIRLVVVARHCTIKQAVQIIETLINKARESNFDF